MKVNGNAIQNEVIAAIRDDIIYRKYPFGSRLPSGKELAKQLGVCYVTVNRAMRQLEADGYIECRHGVGTFVCYVNELTPPKRKIVNLITQVDHEPGGTFFADGRRLFEKAGWQVKTFGINSSINEIKMEINSPDAYSVLFVFNPCFDEFKATMEHIYNRVIHIGDSYNNGEFACVTCDETQTLSLLLNHLKEQGCSKTGLVAYNLKRNTETYRYAAWQSLMMAGGKDFEWCARHFYHVFADDALNKGWLRDSCIDLLKSPSFKELDSIIIPWDPHAVTFINICRENGIRVPEDIAVVSIGNLEEAKSCFPPLTSIDNNFIGHLELARDILEHRFRGAEDGRLLYFCQPSLTPRESSLRKSGITPENNRRNNQSKEKQHEYAAK